MRFLMRKTLGMKSLGVMIRAEDQKPTFLENMILFFGMVKQKIIVFLRCGCFAT